MSTLNFNFDFVFNSGSAINMVLFSDTWFEQNVCNVFSNKKIITCQI